MASGTEPQIHAEIQSSYGVDTRSVEFRTVADQQAALQTDIDRIRAFPLLPAELAVGGAIYNVHTGELEPHRG